MKLKSFVWFLALELFAIVWAGFVFSQVRDRLVAGYLAGTYFVGFSAFILWRMTRWPRWWRQLSFYPLAIHLFAISLPLLVTRWLERDRPFDQVRVLGLDGPTFHRLSTQVFSVLIFATLIDLIREWKDRRDHRSQNRA